MDLSHVLAACIRKLVGLALILSAITHAGCTRRVVSVQEVDKMIKDQVPVGSDKQRVKVFIDNLTVDSLRIWRGEYYTKPSLQPVGTWDSQKIAELWDRTAEFIGARIFDTQTGFLNHNDINIEFAIDRDGRMIGTVKMMGSEGISGKRFWRTGTNP